MIFRPSLLCVPGICLFAALVARAEQARDAAGWLTYTRQEAREPKHLVVEVEMRMGEKEFVHYQVDRLPNLWRINMENGDTFVGFPRKPWLLSQDWGYTGVPADTKMQQELNRFATDTDLPFTDPVAKDSSQGSLVWKFLDEQVIDGETQTIFERTREHPRKDGFYPIYTFAREKPDARALVRHYEGQFRDTSGKIIPVKMNYFFIDQERSAERRLHFLAAEAQSLKAQMVQQPIRAEGDFAVGPLHQVSPEGADRPAAVSDEAALGKLHLSGVIDGVDSDITSVTAGQKKHIIVHDGLCWISRDDDKTWRLQATPDRSYARMLGAALLYNGSSDLGPKGSTVEEVERKDTSAGVEQHLKVTDPKAQNSSQGFELWITRNKDQKPVISGVKGGVFLFGRLNQIEANYAFAPDAKVRAPAHAELRLPELIHKVSPEELLRQVKEVMTKQTRWRVNATMQDEANEVQVTGLLDGLNSDLTITGKDGSVTRQIIVGRKQYVQEDGKTWKSQPVNRDYYFLVQSPLSIRKGEKIPPFEIVDQDWLDAGGAQVRLRYRNPQATEDENDTDRPNFWIEIHKDGGVELTRYSGPVRFQSRFVTNSVEYDLPESPGEIVQAPGVKKRK